MSPTMTEGNIASWKVKEGTENPERRGQRYSDPNCSPRRRLFLYWRCPT